MTDGPGQPARLARVRWAWWAWLLCSLIGCLLIALPDPDRRLFSISETHGPGAVDLVGALVLTSGWVVLDVQIWLGRRRLRTLRRPRLLALVLLVLTGAAIIAFSVLRDAGMWWLLGTAMVAVAQVVAAAVAASGSDTGGPGQVERRTSEVADRDESVNANLLDGVET